MNPIIETNKIFNAAIDAELGSLSPTEQLLIAAERAFQWNVEFSSKFTAQKDFLEDNLMEQFPAIELQKAIKRIKEENK